MGDTNRPELGRGFSTVPYRVHIFKFTSILQAQRWRTICNHGRPVHHKHIEGNGGGLSRKSASKLLPNKSNHTTCFLSTMISILPSESSPLKFSFEIERTIYTLAVHAHPEMRLTLRLVCRRAAQWCVFPRFAKRCSLTWGLGKISTLNQDLSRLPCSPSEGNSFPVARLPPELEHAIFTFLASKHPEMHSTLKLVCHRVKQWCVFFHLDSPESNLRTG